ncbi:MAG: hypothetical protein IJO52_04985 [Clostridia bacterium]|nr:hypothetical protein [Clostridia bacterium]
MDKKCAHKKDRVNTTLEPPYKTLALADDEKRDKKNNAAMPSREAVEAARDWSVENKL